MPFHFELVSPEKPLLNKSIAMVTIPGEEGYFTVLPGHTNVVSKIVSGVIDVFEKENSGASDHIFVAGGFAEVDGDRCTVTAQEAIPVVDLNREQIKEELANLEEDLGLAQEDSERDEVEAKLVVVRAKLQAIQ